MASCRADSVFGVETEFGCLVESSELTPEQAVAAIKNHVFDEMRLGLKDLHARDEVFEPADSGGFLLNGGRLYVDAVGSHLEYATAECRSLKELVANDRAGRRIMLRAIDELGLAKCVRVYNNSIDHFGGHTFGCHENYLTAMDEDFFGYRAPLLIPFLVTRQIFAGAGRVGGHYLVGGGLPDAREVARNPEDYIWVSQIYDALPDDSVEFQISQRADHILKTVASRVRFNRAMINPKWEHYYAHGGKHRLHLLFGEANQSEYAYALKVGTTALVLRLIEDEACPSGLELAEPLMALRQISRDPDYKWRLLLWDGAQTDALSVQREYLQTAKRYRGEEVEWVLREWERTLEQLHDDPLATSDRLDWSAKRRLVELYMDQNGLEWGDDALHSVDLEYHNIRSSESLFDAYSEQYGMERLTDDADIAEAVTEPPANTRAAARSSVISRLLDEKVRRPYMIDWNAILLGRDAYIDLSDPYDSTSPDLPPP